MTRPSTDDLLELARSRNVTAEDLAATVTQLKEQEAEELNNDGLRAQITYITSREGLRSAHELLSTLGGNAP